MAPRDLIVFVLVGIASARYAQQSNRKSLVIPMHHNGSHNDNNAGMSDGHHVASPPERGSVADTGAVAAEGGATSQRANGGGTACSCVCGERTVWKREIFNGNVVEEKEKECHEEVCPKANIPGLITKAECTYVQDIEELTAGTLCQCRCGDKTVWRNRGFYGNVVEYRERQCLEDICPRVSPTPGLRFEAKCRFEPRLFANQGGAHRSALLSTLAMLVALSAAVL